MPVPGLIPACGPVAAGGALVCTDMGNISSVGTNIGDFPNNLSAAFDFTTSQNSSASTTAGNSQTSKYVGKDWGSGTTRTICKYVLYNPSDNNLFFNAAGTRTVKLQGSTDNFSSSIVTLHTLDASVGDSVGKVWTVDSGITQTTAYRYHRWLFETSSAQNFGLAEIRVWELQ